MDYLYDGTFEGLMTCIYYHYKKGKATGIYVISNYQQSIVYQSEIVETDILKAEIVSDAINRLISKEAYVHVYYCYLSNDAEKENLILDFLIFAFKYGRNTMNFYTHEKVLPINEIYKRVAREEHRVLGILRFSEIGGILYAKYSPDNDISILLADHFADRYKHEKFIIYDEKRKKVVVYANNNWEIKENINIDDIEFSIKETMIQKLWKQYFTDLAIKERKNINLQFQFVPSRYRKNMTEFK
ncbi:MAG: TIGR03915 family putative DNA repair protein [Tissierellia bacterium]|jgi:probable DNA metabolism protein|nr:TIGR03915 family putative DNA repair protein [Tissierellia bacterium]MDD3226499.1 TIGR03915 family putative DNA repair protein [Tissierellia bacterium]MDD3750797.1 TIGR03915 family putative DNA repair protein [Tissierellia bacterium]MDD4046356.1 TIGR03915 family putative DNA repair protein [Tissierellia bacterium]MDD4678142.1 TIGR03915 family putative DNA repair protein [Tissierellia bacterium]